jgi:hypothetical protein
VGGDPRSEPGRNTFASTGHGLGGGSPLVPSPKGEGKVPAAEQARREVGGGGKPAGVVKLLWMFRTRLASPSISARSSPSHLPRAFRPVEENQGRDSGQPPASRVIRARSSAPNHGSLPAGRFSPT